MTRRPHGTGAAELPPGLFDRRHDPGRHPTPDRNDTPAPRPFVPLNDMLVNRTRDPYHLEGTHE
ncbi:hypothetical protein AB0K29_10730 [Micromonospora humida]